MVRIVYRTKGPARHQEFITTIVLLIAVPLAIGLATAPRELVDLLIIATACLLVSVFLVYYVISYRRKKARRRRVQAALASYQGKAKHEQSS